MFACLAMAAFFAACEGAFLALSAGPEKSFAETASRRALPAESLLARSDRLQHGITLGHLLGVVWFVALAWLAVRRVAGAEAGLAVFVVSALMIALIVLVPIEIVSKALSMERPGGWARSASPLLAAWMAITFPVTAPLAWLIQRSRAARTAGALPAAAVLTSENMRSMVARTSGQSGIEQDQRQMITSIFSFGETTVREVMTPRPDIVSIDIRTSLPETVRQIREAEHSRVPVHEENLDAIIGVLYAKDFLAMAHGQAAFPADLRGLLREPTFVPEAKRIDDLLREFQADRIHLAVVVDEYGGTAGIVTLEDILEELVGEIQDEYDREDPLVERLDGGVLRLDGRLDFDDFNELTGSRFEAEGVETIGGLVGRELGRVATGGEEVAIGDWVFRVEAVDGKRIVKVLARPETPPEAG